MTKWIFAMVALVVVVSVVFADPPAAPVIYIEAGGELTCISSCADATTEGYDWCMDFEADSTDGTCDNETGATEDSGQTDCDSAGTGGTPEGSHVLHMGDGTGGGDDNIYFEQAFNSGDQDEMWCRGWYQLVSTDSNDNGENAILWMPAAGELYDNDFSAYGAMRADVDATPQLHVACESSSGGIGTAQDIDEDTWYKLSTSYENTGSSACASELCIDGDFGDSSPTCETITGNAGFNDDDGPDGLWFSNRASQSGHNVEWEVDLWYCHTEEPLPLCDM